MFWFILSICSIITGICLQILKSEPQIFVQKDGIAIVLGILASLAIFSIGMVISNLCYSGELIIDDPIKMESFIIDETSTFTDFNGDQLTIRIDGKFETYNLGNIKILPLVEEDEPYIVKSRNHYKVSDSFWVIQISDIIENNKTEIYLNLN